MSSTFEGAEKIVSTLDLLTRKKFPNGKDKVSVIVGFEAAYAISVHENIEMKWRGQPRRSGIGVYWGPHGQAKFLEEPARVNVNKYASIARNVVANGGTVEQGLVAAGLELQRDSQNLVPVEYGNLKASAFTEVET